MAFSALPRNERRKAGCTDVTGFADDIKNKLIKEKKHMKSKKSALLLSFTSLLLCFAMLAGSTFAWFTDTATTGVNKIVAGNLDVELLMYKDNEYANISKEPAPIFGSETSTVAQNNNLNTLWEPGKTQVAYLAIKNEGNLDLKYQVALNVTNPADGKDLYKVMQYAIAPDAKGTDSALPAWTGGKTVTPGTQIVSGTNTTDADPAGVKLLHGETHYFALLVHMDGNAGNAYQNGKVEFDLKVYATQLNSENDSFGPDYDKDAQYPIVAMDTLQELINNAAEPVSAKLEGNIAGSLTVPQGKNITLDLNGFTLTGGDSHAILNRGTLCIKDSSGNGKIVASKANTSALRNGDNAVCVVEGGTFTRAEAEGNKWHTVENFGTMTFNGGKVIAEDGQSFAIVNGWNYIPSEQIPSEQKAIMTINNIDMKAGPNGFKNCAGGTLTMNDGILHCTGYWGLSNDSTGVATINGGEITSDRYIAISDGGAKMEINGGTFTGPQGSLYVQNYAKETVVKGGSYQNETVEFMKNYCPEGYTATLNGDKVVVSKN